jgi:uncharacterized cupredoxin-like copper-binding protein
MMHGGAFGALAVLLVAIVAGCGDDGTTDVGPGSSSGTVIDVTMTDMAYTPDTFTVAAGDEVTFRFTNDGTVDHEAFIGSAAEQAEHESDMPSRGGMDETDDMDGMDGDGMDGMEHGGSTGEAIIVEPGETGELTHRFTEPGQVLIGCHEPGHYAAGMKAAITVN